MNEMWLIAVLLSVIAALLVMLVVMLGWMGNKLYHKLVSLTDTIAALDKILNIRINEQDRRVTILETRFPPHMEAVPP